uniref:Uncharacterized protein n=1 Tax=Aegilops tauschii subsp. strangulata TaxID=200361 RepID=A0A453NIS5_AEGTS
SHSIKRWQAALVLNASRRFRYTLDLKKEEEKEQIRRKIRAHAQVIRVKGLTNLLKTNPEKGIHGDEADLSCRANAFGANRYPRKKGKSFWGIKEGWYDGASIAFAVFLVILVTAVSDYKQSLQFQHLNEEKQNIQVEVVS